MNTETPDHRKLPRELQAVLHIFNYEDELRTKALPHVNIARQSINWPAIWDNDFGGAMPLPFSSPRLYGAIA